jgi:hypothetical protein
MNLSQEDAQKKLDKALKRNLETQNNPVSTENKVSTTQQNIENVE